MVIELNDIKNSSYYKTLNARKYSNPKGYQTYDLIIEHICYIILTIEKNFTSYENLETIQKGVYNILRTYHDLKGKPYWLSNESITLLEKKQSEYYNGRIK